MKELKKNDITEIVVILDRSGSMGPLRDDTVGGFNTFIEDQQKLPGKALFTTVVFSNESELLYDRVPINEVKPMTRDMFRPTGMTALMDALGMAIERTVSIRRLMPEELRADRVVFAVITDGMENASRMYSADKVRGMIKRQQEEHGWEFLFLAANIDAAETAARYGIAPERAVNFHADSKGMHANLSAVSRAVCSMRMSEDAKVCDDWAEEAREDFKRKK